MPLNYRSVLLLSALLLALPFYGKCLPANGVNDYYFRSLEVEDGLSQNMIYSIVQDPLGFMWFATQDGLNRYDGTGFRVFKKDNGDPHSIGNDAVFSLECDARGRLWVGTADGIYIYEPVTERFSRFEEATAAGDKVEGIVRDIKAEGDGTMWMAVSGKGIFCYSEEAGLKLPGKASYSESTDYRRVGVSPTGYIYAATHGEGLLKIPASGETVERYYLDPEHTDSADNDLNDVCILPSGMLLLGTSNRGVQLLDPDTGTLVPLIGTGADGRPLFVRRIFRCSADELWIGTESGVYIYNLPDNTYTNLRHNYNDPFSVSDNAVHSIYRDMEGGMWVGTFFGGVNYYSPYNSQFEKYFPMEGMNSVSGKSISEFCEDSSGNIWIGTEDAGLNRFDPATRKFTSGFLPAMNIHALMCENGSLWVGTFSDGLFIYDPATGNTRNFRNSSSPASISNDNIYSIYRDSRGTVWVGTMKGLDIFEGRNSFRRVLPDEIASQVNDILEDDTGRLWFATLGEGVFAYDMSLDRWKHYPNVFGDNSTSGKMITCLLKDSDGRVWAGTEGGGVVLYDPVPDSFGGNITIADGLPNNVVYQLVEDMDGNIWGSTNKGLFRLDPGEETISVFTHSRGLLGDQFNYKSGFISRTGKMYFGGVKGFVAFLPQNLQTNGYTPPVILNSLQIYNKEVEIAGQGSPLETSVTHTTSITLPYRASVFSIGFAALSYVSPAGNHYAYRLEGWDKGWIHSDEHQRVSYSNLPPGKYVFRVMASNSDGLWNTEGVAIPVRILPPAYRTPLAYILYTLAAVFSAVMAFRYFNRRIKKRNRQALREMEQRKETEIYNAKIEFFTNLTHEIRTPLSLIKAPLEEVMKNVGSGDPNYENLSITQRNTNRLLQLVNQLLDFRKSEVGNMGITYRPTDVAGLIEETVSRFVPSAQLQGKEMTAQLSAGDFKADIDPEIFTKILSNLLNNALKHGAARVWVSLETGPDNFSVRVSNDGEKLNHIYSERIFEPFFKLDTHTQGSGIGLPFARSLAELHGGNLYLDTSADVTSFVATLPREHKNAITVGHAEGKPTEEPANRIPEEVLGQIHRRKVLIVEDNEEFRKFIVGKMKGTYAIAEAANGREALEILKRENIDVVITDIMMPLMDGIALCREIKSDLKYSHIPVVFLTAKTTIQSKIEGIKTGADEYIEKPFSVEYLMARTENLLENRTKIMESYKSSPEAAIDTIAHSKADEEFLRTVIEAIESRIEETDLDVDKLAGAMNMSRATFYRKVRNISELTPNDFIRLIRLKKAAQLLREKEYRVNEIAFIVGFSSSSYFSKCFYKQFGVLPKDFARGK